MRRDPAERLVAWAVTGPPGHLWSAAADIAVIWVRYGVARALAGAGSRFNRRR